MLFRPGTLPHVHRIKGYIKEKALKVLMEIEFN